MSTISKIEVETWTADVENAGTDDRIDCIITFMDNRSFQQQLNNIDPNPFDNLDFDDFERGERNRFNLDLTTLPAVAAISGQQHTDIKSITIKKINGTNGWKCEAVGIRVNDIVLLSRKFKVIKTLDAVGASFTVTLRKTGVLDGLEIKITTGKFNSSDTPSTDDPVYFGLKFINSSFEILDLHLFSSEHDGWDGDDFHKGRTYSYLIPLWEDGTWQNQDAVWLGNGVFNNVPVDIDEIKLRKTGSDGWFLQGAVMYANGNPIEIFGNNNINQFLDDDPEVLNIVDWSSKGFRKAGFISHTVVSPVLGYISDTTASVQYRIRIDTREPGPWSLVVNYRNFAIGNTFLIPPKVYTLTDNQFKW